MRIMAPGLDPRTGRLLVEPIDSEAFARALLGRLEVRGEDLRPLTAATATGTTFRGEVHRRSTRDLGDPRSAGWTYLVAADDPDGEEIGEVLRPLAEHRGMRPGTPPLVFAGEPQEEWMDWMLERYWAVEREAPHYVLIVGGPERVPFHFQAVLDSAAAVGRVALDSLDDLGAYVEKVLRIEGSPEPIAHREAVMLATDHGHPDPTYYSRRYMAEPLSRHIQDVLQVPVTTLSAERATVANLLASLDGPAPALVYTASHGAGLLGAPLAEQQRLNGAIVCASERAAEPALFGAEQVPMGRSFVEGGIVFQFACFGYGTPAESDYAHWLGEDTVNAEADFVAALPKRLLAHPRGPVAYIGHVDLAWLHAFDDPDAPDLAETWHPRLAPFVRAVETLLTAQPVGLAMEAMNRRFDIGNAQMASTFDRQKRGRLPDRPDVLEAIVRAFITRSDAQNYLVFGDPAVGLRMSD